MEMRRNYRKKYILKRFKTVPFVLQMSEARGQRRQS